MRGEHLFELPVRAEFRRDEAGEAVGQALGGAHLADRVAQRLLEEGEERRDLGRWRFAGWLGALDKRNGFDIGGALRDRLERLAVVPGGGRYPECVDRVGQQQNLDAAGAESFKLRAGLDALQVLAGQIENRG